jgi:hypothetical protein
LDRNGLINSIFVSVYSIDIGRKSFATRGKEQEGRISYEDGISRALTAFQEAQASADPETIILSEYTFLGQELQFCNEQDTDTRSSLTQAVQSFEDDVRRVSASSILPIGKRSVATYAFLALEAVRESGYITVDKAFPHNIKNRIQGFPKDSFHQAAIAHRTRLSNSLRTPGIDMIEKALLRQRAANMTTAQNSYIAKQKTALS